MGAAACVVRVGRRVGAGGVDGGDDAVPRRSCKRMAKSD